MPGKNSIECLRLISEDPQLKTFPGTIYSTIINPADVDDTFKHGTSFFLRKFNSYDSMIILFDEAKEGFVDADSEMGQDSTFHVFLAFSN